jgi:hypothetical protein
VVQAEQEPLYTAIMSAVRLAQAQQQPVDVTLLWGGLNTLLRTDDSQAASAVAEAVNRRDAVSGTNVSSVAHNPQQCSGAARGLALRAAAMDVDMRDALTTGRLLPLLAGVVGRGLEGAATAAAAGGAERAAEMARLQQLLDVTQALLQGLEAGLLAAAAGAAPAGGAAAAGAATEAAAHPASGAAGPQAGAEPPPAAADAAAAVHQQQAGAAGGLGGGGAYTGAYGPATPHAEAASVPAKRKRATPSSCQPIYEEAHRMLAWLAYGPPPRSAGGPAKAVAGHLCGNPRCLNVLHLAWMTHTQNMAFHNARGHVRQRIDAGRAYLHVYRDQLGRRGGVWRSSTNATSPAT